MAGLRRPAAAAARELGGRAAVEATTALCGGGGRGAARLRRGGPGPHPLPFPAVAGSSASRGWLQRMRRGRVDRGHERVADAAVGGGRSRTDRGVARGAGHLSRRAGNDRGAAGGGAGRRRARAQLGDVRLGDAAPHGQVGAGGGARAEGPPPALAGWVWRGGRGLVPPRALGERRRARRRRELGDRLGGLVARAAHRAPRRRPRRRPAARAAAAGGRVGGGRRRLRPALRFPAQRAYGGAAPRAPPRRCGRARGGRGALGGAHGGGRAVLLRAERPRPVRARAQLHRGRARAARDRRAVRALGARGRQRSWVQVPSALSEDSAPRCTARSAR